MYTYTSKSDELNIVCHSWQPHYKLLLFHTSYARNSIDLCIICVFILQLNNVTSKLLFSLSSYKFIVIIDNRMFTLLTCNTTPYFSSRITLTYYIYLSYNFSSDVATPRLSGQPSGLAVSSQPRRKWYYLRNFPTAVPQNCLLHKNRKF